jgi:CarboxypepD_reg-like domain
MSKKIQLSIPTPCHENWDNMTPVQQGKFCDSCQKQVIDFSNMSDREIATFFKKPSTGSVCGRFMQDQLDKSIEIPKKRIPWVKYFFQISLPVFLASLKTSAQSNEIMGKPKAGVCSREIKGQTSLLNAIQKNILSDTIPIPKENGFIKQYESVFIGTVGMISVDKQRINKAMIKGRIIDENGNGIANATVMIKETKFGIAADENGFFSIKLKSGLRNLIVSSAGFETKEIDVKLGEFKNLIVQLDAVQMLGEVVVASDVYRKRMGGLISCVRITKTRALLTSLFHADSAKNILIQYDQVVQSI